MPRRFDHVDLRVSNMEEASPFYLQVLPALGFTRDARIPGWLQFEASDGVITEFFGVTESPGHQPNENRIALWAENTEEVDRLAQIIRNAGGRKIEGPGFEAPGYYAVFFEDPCGNRLEVCHRTAG